MLRHVVELLLKKNKKTELNCSLIYAAQEARWTVGDIHEPTSCLKLRSSLCSFRNSGTRPSTLPSMWFTAVASKCCGCPADLLFVLVVAKVSSESSLGAKGGLTSHVCWSSCCCCFCTPARTYCSCFRAQIEERSKGALFCEEQ